ncbi:MAG: hypothetical protein A2521_05790 [Deltaproteobacteria bacterium RIFOXYD12_FULL_57_12]|nr:MAG: hypothetical protein A2521_05790 [Deltaproteobacteria bacterium RIFOXYD12_FULL_57_12]
MWVSPDRREYVKVVLPAVAAVLLFVVAMFGVFLPNYQRSLLDDKKEMIRELTITAWNVLALMEQKEARGELDRPAAQQAAMEQIRQLRYGDEGKDYFWINDMRPVMIMHPYRTDLEGQDLSGFVDPAGGHLFLDFVETVKKADEGYVQYLWQWKDDSKKIVPKLSFVKGFAPWGWIIGTGIYLEDVRQEIHGLTRKLLLSTLGILVLVGMLTVLLVSQALKAAQLRRRAEQDLRDHQAHLENLVLARTSDLKQVNEKLADEVAERVQAEEAVRRQNTFLHTVIESLPYPFFVVNTRTHGIILANSAAARQGQGEDVTCHALTHGQDQPCDGIDYTCPLQFVTQTGKSMICEHVHLDEAGREQIMEVHAAPIFDDDGQVVQMIEYAIDITDRKRVEEEREELIVDLRAALAQIKTLRGILPICSFCKQIRDDKGYWNQLEQYVTEHSGAEFSHGICPKCLKEHYPEFVEKNGG